ncbi:fimbrial protein [Serratia bockelmannii]|uniref:fimbrial protein n=1 Tax=Serratia bockelmannii TaxID=2703793 RepID=UPI00165E3ED0|nr:fimbrial protein [Serratia bockelmannii]
MRIHSYITMAFAIFCYSKLASAYSGECSPVGGISTIIADIGNLNVDSTSGNDVGKIVTEDMLFTAAGLPYKGSCDIGKSEETNVYLTTKVPLTEGTNGWYILNDYLSVKTKTWIDGGVKAYRINPFEAISNENPEKNGGVTIWNTGGKGRVSIRIDKRFIGFSPFNKLVLVGYANAYKTGISSNPMFQLYLKGSVTVPQSCDLDTGKTITMDFGNIGAPLFPEAGAGNKPEGVNPQTHTIAIQCKNIEAQALLSMRIEANKVAGNALVSDNKDVGFIVADKYKKPLTPNNINSNIKFQLDDNASARIPITAWPVSITGRKPAEGKFTAEGYLRIDFD